MMLSKNFQLAELCISQTADRMGLDNNPNEAIITNLRILANGLESIRALVNLPILVSSGYRSPVVNKLVGGQPNSQHLTGSAADITCPRYGDPKNLLKAIIAAKLPFDQCILEYYQGATFNTPARGWVHVSFVTTEPRYEVLVIDGHGTRPYLA
jgi:zinc D-Ala-D-Ala carboxypeptidase